MKYSSGRWFSSNGFASTEEVKKHLKDEGYNLEKPEKIKTTQPVGTLVSSGIISKSESKKEAEKNSSPERDIKYSGGRWRNKGRYASKTEVLKELKNRGYIILNEEAIKTSQPVGTMINAGYIKKEIREPPTEEFYYSVAGYNYDDEIEAEVWIFSDEPIEEEDLEEQFKTLVLQLYPPSGGAGGLYGLTRTSVEMNERVLNRSQVSHLNHFQGKLIFKTEGNKEFCGLSRTEYGDLDMTQCRNLEKR